MLAHVMLLAGNFEDMVEYYKYFRGAGRGWSFPRIFILPLTFALVLPSQALPTLVSYRPRA